MLFWALCIIGFTSYAILIALFPALYGFGAPHQRRTYQRVAGTSLTALLLAACAWAITLTEHFLAFDFPFHSSRGTELRRLLHIVAPSIAGVAFLLAIIQANAFWRKRTTETLCGHCGYPLSNAEHTSTICAECGTTTTELHPIPPGFRPTTRLSIANTLARFVLIAAAATLGWSLIYIPHIPTPPRISTHHIECAAPDRPSADIQFTITEHRNRLPIPGASFVAHIDIRAESDGKDERRTRITLIREPFAEIRALVDEAKFIHSSHQFSTGLRMPEYPRHQFTFSRIDTIGDGTYRLILGVDDERAWCEPLSKVSVHVSPQLIRWPDPRRPCLRDEMQAHIDRLIERHTAPMLLPASSPSSTPTTAARFAELIAAGTTGTIAVLFALLGLRIADRRRSRSPVGR